MNTPDRRVRKSKEALYNAAAVLMKQKNLTSVTIKELTELADINRGTFYAHYKDIFDFIECLENDIIADLADICKRFPPYQNMETLFPMVEVIINYFAQEPYCLMLTSSNQNSKLTSKIIKTIRTNYLFDRINVIFAEDQDDDDITLYGDFVISGFLTLISSWLEEGKPTTPEQLAVKINKLLISALNFFTDQPKA